MPPGLTLPSNSGVIRVRPDRGSEPTPVCAPSRRARDCRGECACSSTPWRAGLPTSKRSSTANSQEVTALPDGQQDNDCDRIAGCKSARVRSGSFVPDVLVALASCMLGRLLDTPARARFTNSPPASAKSHGWFSALFVGYDESRHCLTMINGRSAHIAVIPQGVANATDIPIGDGQIGEEFGGAGVENGHVFSARLAAERAAEPTLAQAARPVRSKLRRSAIQSQAASLRRARGRSQGGI